MKQNITIEQTEADNIRDGIFAMIMDIVSNENYVHYRENIQKYKEEKEND